MKNVVSIIILAALLLVGACSSDRGDPVASGDGGTSLGGQNLANATVNDGNSIEFYMAMLNQLFPSYQSGLFAVLSYTGTGTTVNFLGTFTGNAIVSLTPDDTSDTLVPVLTVDYNNFSNSGRLFYSGTMTYTSEWRGSGSSQVLHAWVLDGSVKFAGDYAGSVEFVNMHVGLESDGTPADLIERAQNPQRNLPLEGDVIILSGGGRISFNPNFVDHPLGPG